MERATEDLTNRYSTEIFNLQDKCPNCSANWKSLQEDLVTEPLCSYALDQALIIIKNCAVCCLKFKAQLGVIDRVYRARRLDKVGIERKKEGR